MTKNTSRGYSGPFRQSTCHHSVLFCWNASEKYH